MNMTKKIVAVLTALTVSVWLVGPGVAQGQTVEELQAQIAALQAQLAQLQAQLAQLQGGASGAQVKCTFTRNLYPGVTGDDVKCLQQYLNSAGFKLADTGPGSPGNETTFYGPLTKAAVQKWQDANNIAYGAWGGYFGPISRAKYVELTTVPSEEGPSEEGPSEEVPPAEEGTLSVSWQVLPTGVTVREGETKNVAAFKVKAQQSSIKVQRIDLTMFTLAPWKVLTNIALYDGANLIKELAVSKDTLIEVDPGAKYTARFTAPELLNIPKNGEKVVTVQVTAASIFPSGFPNSVNLEIPMNGIRGVDTAGIQQYAEITGSAFKSFNLASTAAGALELSLNVGSPKVGAAIVDPNADTEIELTKVDLKAENRDLILTTLNVDVTTTGSFGTLKVLNLYDGDTLLGSREATTGTFDGLQVAIAKDTTKTLTVKLVATGTPAGGSVDVNVLSTGSAAIDADYNPVTPTGTADGRTIYLYNVAPKIELSSTSITKNTEGDIAEYKIVFKVTALGGDVYVAKTAAANNTAQTGKITAYVDPDPSAASVVLATVSATGFEIEDTNSWKITKDTTATITVLVNLNNSAVGTSPGYFKGKVVGIAWGITDAGANGDNTFLPFETQDLVTDPTYVGT